MEYLQLTPVHIIGGTVGLLSGAIAVLVAKGSTPHRIAGNIFFVFMLIMSGTGAFLAYFEPAAASVVAGLLTFYMVATGWATVMRREKTIGPFEVIAFFWAVGVAYYGLSAGMEAAASEAGRKDGFPAGLYYAFGGITAFAALMDITMIARRGLAGRQRIARHLWRMCFALLMATSSFFLGQSQVIPEPIRILPVLITPVFAVIGVLFFWLARVLFTRWADAA